VGRREHWKRWAVFVSEPAWGTCLMLTARLGPLGKISPSRSRAVERYSFDTGAAWCGETRHSVSIREVLEKYL
jgi:hypothetical protein